MTKDNSVVKSGFLSRKEYSKVFIIISGLTLILILLLLGKFIFFKSNDKRPNIVLLIIDTLRSDKLGCYGFEEPVSPEIDQMAAEGVLFENAIAQCSWTRPSIASMITSLYPRTIGIEKENFDILHNKYQTFAEILKFNGYKTIGITANPTINSVFNFQQGFDRYIDSWVVWDWMKPNAGQKKFGKNSSIPGSDEILDKLIKQLKPSNGSPTYLQINLMDVHAPFENLRAEYKNAFNYLKTKRPNRYYPESLLQYIISGTLGAIRQVSFDFRIFIKKLKKIPGWENTLFIITSDHGEGLDDHPNVKESIGHGYLLYESQIKVPLIFYHTFPNKNNKKDTSLFKPNRIKQKVRLMDIMPTVLDFLKIKIPEYFHGTSLLPLVRNKREKTELPDFFITETKWRNIHKVGVYSDKWNYIENRDYWGEAEGVEAIELQPNGIKENGFKTSQFKQKASIAFSMKKYLQQWEKKHTKSKRTLPEKKIKNKTIEMLKSLGYLGN